MRQNVANVNASKPVADFSDQPVLIPFDIENRPFADGICAGKSLSQVCPIPPGSLLCYAKPRVQRAFKIEVPFTGFLQFLAADYVHAATREFALCEDYSSQNAKRQALDMQPSDSCSRQAGMDARLLLFRGFQLR
jgi:hypothetical protein